MNSYETLTEEVTINRLSAAPPMEAVIATLEPGTMVGHYALEGRLGHPASQAYAAVNARTDEPVVVKMSGKDGVQAMLRETVLHRQAARNEHVADVDGHGLWKGQAFLATRRQEGGTLAEEFGGSDATTKARITGIIEQLDHELELVDTAEHRSIGPDVNEVKERLTMNSKLHLVGELEARSVLAVDDVLEAVALVAHESGQEIDPHSLIAKELTRQLLHDLTIDVPTTADRGEILRRCNLLYGIADAAASLHSLNIVHRDLKKANAGVDLTGATARVFDFGIATRKRRVDPKRLLCTPATVPPEGCNGLILPEYDTYGLGLIAYEVLTGINPRPWDNTKSLSENLAIMRNALEPMNPADLNPNIQRSVGNAVIRAIDLDYRRRGPTADVRDAFGQAIAA